MRVLLLACAAAAVPALAQVRDVDDRDLALFGRWRVPHAAGVDAFTQYLQRERVAQVAPVYQLLRSASMWKECGAEPFELPPATEWAEVKRVLELMQHLRDRRILIDFEVVSGYRSPTLNRCAGGAPRSAHRRFAIDVAPLRIEQAVALCRFWHTEGERWEMGLSRYPTGRVHIDRVGYRTWGSDFSSRTSFCRTDAAR